MKSNLISNRIEELNKIFEEIAGDDEYISQANFKKALDLKNPDIADRLFKIFDIDETGRISIQEFINSVEELIMGDTETLLRFAFRLHDYHENGAIDKAELKYFFLSSIHENNLDVPHEQIDDLVELFFQEADTSNDGKISFPEFKNLILKFPDLKDKMTVSSVAWLMPQQPKPELISPEERRKMKRIQRKHYLQNNWVVITFLVLYIVINFILFFNAFFYYHSQGANIYIQVARGFGATLNFNGALILIPVMRHFMTWLRKSPLNNYLPLDANIEFHKFVGQMMFAFAAFHTIAHFFNYANNPESITIDNAEFYAVTGVLLLLVFTIICVTSQEKVRVKGNFNLFYIAHFAYVPWFVLALLHGRNFWIWTIIPLIGFGVEQILRWQTRNEPAYVSNAVLLPSRVLNLTINRPPSINFQPGDYVFLRCPTVSRFEWHPFSISSAPEQTDTLSLHIRAVGSWTNRIYQLFQKTCRETWDRPDYFPSDSSMEVYLDGPYGTPSSHIVDSKYAMIIAAGIGVTPFASILTSILERQKRDPLDTRLEKVHFYWLNREQESFEWFIKLLTTLEQEDTDNLFDIHLYLTGAQEKSNLISSTLFMAMDLYRSHSEVDLITGLKSPTKTGRPDWDKVFGDVATQHKPERVDVFFCGPPGLSRILNQMSNKYGFGYRKENF